ncbi:hypothetical protein LMG29542_07600 [Paraburkholderia humisilvae]|uniref:Uncharacterized protein n=1 Tax=Paraburkholderia humisilvae TaxID=627669 RepID=A0A6J5F8N5_9BURK|nr:hypothetical protein LMG29542_07600 [Paraburkholderia humisilvae]
MRIPANLGSLSWRLAIVVLPWLQPVARGCFNQMLPATLRQTRVSRMRDGLFRHRRIDNRPPCFESLSRCAWRRGGSLLSASPFLERRPDPPESHALLLKPQSMANPVVAKVVEEFPLFSRESRQIARHLIAFFPPEWFMRH